MFTKLLKHEWNASRKTMTILTLAMLGMGVLATISLRVLIASGRGMIENENPFMILLIMAMGVFMGACYLGALAYVIAVQFILLYRFYKNKFTDEGYLTFTLPVQVKDIFWSSFVNMLIWSVISVVTLVLVLLCVILFGTATDGLVNLDAFRAIGDLFSIFAQLPWDVLIKSPVSMVVLCIIYGLQLLVAPVFSLVLPMASITMGAVLAKKHKILAAFGIYYGISSITGTILSVVSSFPLVFFIGAETGEGYYILSGLINLVATAAMTVGGYYISVYLMKHKLNLP